MKNLFFVTFCVITLTLFSCGGGGGGSSSSDGVLRAQFRTNGLSAAYTNDANYKALVDDFFDVMRLTFSEINNIIKWPKDVPIVFSGCGGENAFWYGPTSETSSIHPVVNSGWANNLADAERVFGPDIVLGPNNRYDSISVFCNELTEKTFEVLAGATYLNSIQEFVTAGFFDDIDEGYLFSAYMFELQVLFHELGHGVDRIFLMDMSDMVKMDNFSIPKPDTCSQANCDTIGEDFADWISAYILADALREAFEDTTMDGVELSENITAGYIIALGAWGDIIGAGGGVVHGFTSSRQANMLCYVYGALPELRELDTDDVLDGILMDASITPSTCENTYKTNALLRKDYWENILIFKDCH